MTKGGSCPLAIPEGLSQHDIGRKTRSSGRLGPAKAREGDDYSQIRNSTGLKGLSQPSNSQSVPPSSFVGEHQKAKYMWKESTAHGARFDIITEAGFCTYAACVMPQSNSV